MLPHSDTAEVPVEQMPASTGCIAKSLAPARRPDLHLHGDLQPKLRVRPEVSGDNVHSQQSQELLLFLTCQSSIKILLGWVSTYVCPNPPAPAAVKFFNAVCEVAQQASSTILICI